MKLYIIGDLSDKENIDTFCKQFDEAAIEPIPLFSATDFMAKGTAVCSQLAVLWISSKTGDAIFNIANERNEKNLTTINYFADPIALSDSRKKAIGRNHSVFAEINPEESVMGLINLLNRESVEIKPCNDRDDNILNTARSSYADSTLISPTASVLQNSSNIDSMSSENNNVEGEADIEATDEIKEFSPLTAILTMLGSSIGSVILLKMIGLDPGTFGGYIILGIPIVVIYKTLKKLNQWRKLNGFNYKIILAYVTAVISILISLFFLFIWFLSPYW